MAGVTEELNFRFNFNGLLWLLAVSEILGTCASFSFLTVAEDVPFACSSATQRNYQKRGF